MPRLKDEGYIKDTRYDESNIDLLEEDETFKVGQSYEDYAATTIKCTHCGSIYEG